MKKLPLLSLIGVALVVLSFIALKSNPAVEVTLYGDTLAVVEETADTADTSNLDTEESSSEDGKIDIEQDIDETATTPESQFPSLTEGEDSTEQQGEDAVEAEEGLPIPDESDEEDLPSSGWASEGEGAVENVEPVEAESLVDTTAFDASTDIQLTAVISKAGQVVKLNKYFANAFVVDWGDGPAVENVTAAITHTYTGAGTYEITLTKTTSRWTFTGTTVSLIPQAWTTASDVYVSSMPPMSLFGTSEASVGNNFFRYFNNGGALTSLPEGSFDASHITTVGDYFFAYFNQNGSLTSLPAGSFDTSSISGTVGAYFLVNFNYNGYLISLPEGSFDTSNITTVGTYYFYQSFYNSQLSRDAIVQIASTRNLDQTNLNKSNVFTNTFYGNTATGTVTEADIPQLALNPSSAKNTFSNTNLTTDSVNWNNWGFPRVFDTTRDIQLTAVISEAGQVVTLSKYFANAFVVDWGDWSPIASVTAAITHTYATAGTYTIILSKTTARWTFASTSVPLIPKAWTTASNVYVSSLPAMSLFGTSEASVGNYFFSYFNYNGALTSLPAGSFDTSSISGTVGTNFFDRFNYNGALTSLPEGSFDTSNITTVGTNYFFGSFYNNQLSRATILQVASKRSLNQTSLNKSNVFTNTFYGNATTGSVTETDIPQLALNPSSAKNTFAGTNLITDSTNWINWGLSVPTLTPSDSDIQLTAVISEAGQTVKLNKYFANAFAVDWGDWSLIAGVTAAITHTYTGAGTYTITLSKATERWTFASTTVPLIPKAWTTASNVYVSSLPAMSLFGTSEASVGTYFFAYFNYNGALTSLPEGSFDTSSISGTVGTYFFSYFNYNGALTSLPAGSFDTSNISGTVGTYFFYYFNYNGALTSLPVGSFDTSSISGTVGDYFFAYFNYSGALTSLPAGSFDTSSITTVGAYYFAYSFYNNQLSRATILQVASKRSLNQTNLNKSNVFYQTFYGNATTGSVTETDIPQLALNPSDPRNTFAGTNLSTDSTNWINWGFSWIFDASADIQLTAITTWANQTVKLNKYFANAFVVDWGDWSAVENVTAAITHTYATAGTYTIILSKTTARWTFASTSVPLIPKAWTTASNVYVSSLPAMSLFGTSEASVGNYFFSYFNYNGALTSLPSGSFDTSSISGTVGTYFFYYFNYNGALTSLPVGSFDTSSISGTVGDYFFSYFNYNGALTSLPSGSFDTSSISGTVGNYFFSYFNYNGALTSLPSGSFDTSSISGTVGNYFFANFNNNGAITELPEWSFDTSSISGTVGTYFFYYFNYNGALTSLPAGSFDTSSITTVGTYYFAYSFYNNQLSRATILQVASKRSLNQTNLNRANVFAYTFYGNATTGTVTETDIPQLALNPSDPRNTFANTNLTTDSVNWNNWGFPRVFDTTRDIQLTAVISEAGQVVTLSKYFANAFVVDWGDWSPIASVTAAITHTYTGAGTYTITLSKATERWTFASTTVPLIPKAWTTASNVFVSSMPEMSLFGTSEASVGTYFFAYFNYNGALTSLPEGSFDTSSISGTVGTYFFDHFNYNGYLISLPEGSFDTSSISGTVGNYFFSYFNYNGALTSLPEGGFDTSSITTVGDYFFAYFNRGGALTSLPEGSFDTSSITTVGTYYFAYSFYNNQLSRDAIVQIASKRNLNQTNLDKSNVFYQTFYGNATTGSVTEADIPQLALNPSSAMDTFAGTNLITDSTNWINWGLRITSSSPSDSDIQLTAVISEAGQVVTLSKYFANAFVVDWGDWSPIASVTAAITHTYAAAGTYTITLSKTTERWTFASTTVPLIPKAWTTASNVYVSSLPAMSLFGTSETSVGGRFFSYFNYNGALTSLPEGSFDTNHITTVGDYFFAYFNRGGALTSLPEGSFDTSNITTVVNYFFAYFNYNGALTSLPSGSFDTSSISISVGTNFFAYFNREGALTSLPAGSFDTSSITTVGTYYFAYSFYNNQLSRDAIVQIASKRNLNQTNLNRANVFSYTFYGNTATGSVTEADIPQLALNPSSVRGTFANTNLSTNSTNYNWGFIEIVFDIQLTAVISEVGQTVKLNKYFSNAFTVDWGDGSTVQSAAAITHTYTGAGTYTITLSKATERWTFATPAAPLIPKAWTTASNVYVSSMPPMSLFGASETSIGNNFFLRFNYNWALTSLPAGSFDTSSIPGTVGTNFFYLFNSNGNIARNTTTGVAINNISSAATTFSYPGGSVSVPRGGSFGYYNENLVVKVSYTPTSGTLTSWTALATLIANKPLLPLTGRTDLGSWTIFTQSFSENTGFLLLLTGEEYGQTVGVNILITNIDTTPPTVIIEDKDQLSEEVIVVITLDKPAKVTTPGRTLKPSWLPEEAENEANGFGTLREKTYTENITEEVTFYDVLGNEGSTLVEVSTITSSSASAWGGGNSLEKDYCPNGDLSPSYYDGECEQPLRPSDTSPDREENSTGEHNVAEEKTLYETAYERAKGYGITTASTYEDARISDAILRQEMAKMISTYAIKLFQKTPNTSKLECSQFQDVSEVPTELQPYIIQSCELGLMGMYDDGIQVQDNFFPKNSITRAEVGTILSRLLRGTTYATQEGDETYYSRHLQALKKAGIMNFISNPDMLELRGNILLMLWKSVNK